MLQNESYMNVSDNSGARMVKVIRVLGGSNRRIAKLGDMVRVCIRSLDANKKLLRKSIYSGLIVASKSPVRRPDGSSIRSDKNRCLIFTKEGDKFLGSRVDGFVPREIRGGANEVKYKDVISYSGATI